MDFARKLVASTTALGLVVGAAFGAVGAHLLTGGRGGEAVIAFVVAACWMLPMPVIRFIGWRRRRARASEPPPPGAASGV